MKTFRSLSLDQSARNTYIGDEGTRGVSGGERRRVSIGVDIIHGPSLLFLDEPTSGLDSTSAHSVIEKVHDIARTGSTVILTIHQPSSRIQLLLDHLIILARGQLMYQGSPKDVNLHLNRMGRKVRKGENSIEYLIDVIQEYDQSEHGVEVLADFAVTGRKPPFLEDGEMSISAIDPLPMEKKKNQHQMEGEWNGRRNGEMRASQATEYDHSVRSPYNSSMSWSESGVVRQLRSFTPSRKKNGSKMPNPMRYYFISLNLQLLICFEFSNILNISHLVLTGHLQDTTCILVTF